MDSDKEADDTKTTAAIILLAILLPLTLQYSSPQIPYNDLELTGASYTHVILHGNPRRCVDVLRVPSSTFKFICQELFEIEQEPVSKLLSLEEQLAIFLYITGHNNSNRQAQDRFQHSGQTISKYVHANHFFS